MAEAASPPSLPRDRSLRVVFDRGVVAAGLLCALLAAGVLLRSGTALRPALLVAVPTIVLMSRFPLLISRGSSGGLEIGFDSCVLVFLVLVCPIDVALVLWNLGVLAAQLTARKPWATRTFNAGLGVLSGGLAIAAMRLLSTLDHTSPRELGAVAVGCTVYFAADFLVSAVSLGLGDPELSLREGLTDPGVVLALGAFVAIDSLGYLAALVVRGLPPWTVPLFAVPLVTILIAARAVSRAAERHRRLHELFDAAVSAQGLGDLEEVTRDLRRHARRVLRDDDAEVRALPPGAGEVGARLPIDDDVALWVVGRSRNRARASQAEDQEALEALAAVAAESVGRARLHEELERLARHDALTGLCNRTLFTDRVEHALAGRARRGGLVAVLFFDLDRFKGVNDRFGHDAGDALLVAVGERLREVVRPGDTVARLGGDEFAMLLEDVADLAAVTQVCRRVLDAVRREFRVAGRVVNVGTSIGVALSSDAAGAVEIMRNADLAMYRAKSLGRDRFELFEPGLRAQSLERLEMQEQLRDALGGGQLVLRYQPVIDLSTGRVDGFEALLRWRHPLRGYIPPTVFVPLAEESGLIRTIGAWVLEQAWQDAARLAAAAERPISIGVNVSAVQLAGEQLTAQVQRLAADNACGNTLVLEMTESVLIEDDEKTLATLRQLHDLGVRLAIDDFGTGFSSIGYLRHLPVHVLKIDRSFTARIGTDPRSEALVEAITLMSAALDLALVVEGVETPEQVARLRGLGVALAQGFLFAHPMPLVDALAFVAAGAVDVMPEVEVLPSQRARRGHAELS